MLVSVHGSAAVELRAVSGCDSDGRLDAPTLIGAPVVLTRGRDTLVAWRARSALWEQATYRFTFSEDGFRYGYSLRGRGAIDRACYFGHGASLSPGLFRSIWNPEPNSLQRQRLDPGERALVSVNGDKRYHEGNWFFTPAPLCFALEAGPRAWLAAGVAASAETLNCTELATLEGTGFGLALRYDGHASVSGSWDSPEVVFLPARDEHGALESYCRWLRDQGLTPDPGDEPRPRWWGEPIFCGWGEQCAIAGVLPDAEGALAAAAPAQSTQRNYERFLASLDRNGIDPGTVVIDDKWQRTYGENEPHRRRWPDLAGFIQSQHARRRRVLLWLKAWDPEGLPAEECIVDDQGVPVSIDPTTDTYAARLRKTVRALLCDLGADGFKLDFTHAIPSGPVGRSSGGAWGVALMRELLRLYHGAMREVRSDAMLMAHTASPAFADVVDVLRLNDVPLCRGRSKSYVAAMRHRARVARAASARWLIDTDNWPSPDRASFLEYVREQPSLGIPSLYYVSRVRWRTKGEDWIDDPLRAQDYAEIRAAWDRYRAGLTGASEDRVS